MGHSPQSSPPPGSSLLPESSLLQSKSLDIQWTVKLTTLVMRCWHCPALPCSFRTEDYIIPMARSGEERRPWLVRYRGHKRVT